MVEVKRTCIFVHLAIRESHVGWTRIVQQPLDSESYAFRQTQLLRTFLIVDLEKAVLLLNNESSFFFYCTSGCSKCAKNLSQLLGRIAG